MCASRISLSEPTEKALAERSSELAGRVKVFSAEKNYKAALIAHRLKKEHIDFGAKNGVLTLKGSVETAEQRQRAQAAAAGVPNVQQVLNRFRSQRGNSGLVLSAVEK